MDNKVNNANTAAPAASKPVAAGNVTQNRAAVPETIMSTESSGNGGSKMLLVIVGLMLVLVIAAGAYWYLKMGPGVGVNQQANVGAQKQGNNSAVDKSAGTQVDALNIGDDNTDFSDVDSELQNL